MKKYTKSLVAFFLAFVLIFSSCLPIFAVDASVSAQTLVYSKQYNSGKRDTVCTTLEGTSAASYYTGSYTYDELDDLSSSALLASLRKLMTDTHTYKSTYNDCHYKANQTDCENEDGSNQTLLLLYTSYTATQSQWNGWNREHVWPKSLGGNNDDDRGGGADLHHIRPSDAGVNSSRGNKKYGEAGSNASEKYGTDPAVGVLGGTYNSTYFEPNDNVKGDVARICLYVWVRWGSDWGANNVTQVFQSVDVLLKWCKEDPVDTWEMGRNEVIGAIQGNRNVFIDYPEYAWMLFDKEVPDDMITPSGEASKQSSCSHTNTKIVGAIIATCGAGGYSGDTYCVDCEMLLSKGGQISATGLHTYTAWVIDAAQGIKVRTCTGCDKQETQDINAAECSHSYTVTRNKISATCGKAGYTGDTCCLNCGEILTKGKEIAATGNHSYGEIKVINEPTDIKKGLGEQTCSDCDTRSVVFIPAIYSDSELTIDILIANIETDQEKILLLLTLGVTDKALLEELSK